MYCHLMQNKLLSIDIRIRKRLFQGSSELIRDQTGDAAAVTGNKSGLANVKSLDQIRHNILVILLMFHFQILNLSAM